MRTSAHIRERRRTLWGHTTSNRHAGLRASQEGSSLASRARRGRWKAAQVRVLDERIFIIVVVRKAIHPFSTLLGNCEFMRVVLAVESLLDDERFLVDSSEAVSGE